MPVTSTTGAAGVIGPGLALPAPVVAEPSPGHVTSCAMARAWPLLQAAAAAAVPPLAALPNLATLGLSAAESALVASYQDFLRVPPDGIMVLAHLGQSLDGRIATSCGHSSFVTGNANLVHMHRLRALADAVLVGGGTVAHDDPQLTVRLVPGRSPVRVVIDTRRRLSADRRVLQSTKPETWVLCAAEALVGSSLGMANVIGLPADEDGQIAPATILAALRQRGIRRLFIEGGGVTVSRFLAANCLDRLQLCVAPVLIGSGRPAVTLPTIVTMNEATRLAPTMLPMGGDWLFMSELRRQVLPLATQVAAEVAFRVATNGSAASVRQPEHIHVAHA